MKHDIKTLSGKLSLQMFKKIQNGELKPGAKINLNHLSKEYGASLSSIREAVSRLVADGLIELEEQRGYRISSISQNNLNEVTKLNADSECLALQYAIQKGDIDWEGAIMSSLHQLSRIKYDASDPKIVMAWQKAYSNFHTRISEGSEMNDLILFCSRMFNLAERYRQIFSSEYVVMPNMFEEHKLIVDAILEKNVNLACELLRSHIEHSGGSLYKRINHLLPA